MTDDRTANLDLPLPHEDNPLQVDVERLRQALITIDAELAALRQLLNALTAPA